MSRNLESAPELTSVTLLRPADTFTVYRQNAGEAFATPYQTNAVSKMVYVNTAASTAISNTASETAFDASYTIPANSLRAGDVIKVRYQGIATATNSTDTLLVRLRIGGLSGTALLVGTATDVANNNVFGGEFTLIVRTVGSSGTVVGVGTHVEAPAASGTASQATMEILGSTTLDTTADQAVVVTATWSVANAGNSCRLDVMLVEHL